MKRSFPFICWPSMQAIVYICVSKIASYVSTWTPSYALRTWTHCTIELLMNSSICSMHCAIPLHCGLCGGIMRWCIWNRAFSECAPLTRAFNIDIVDEIVHYNSEYISQFLYISCISYSGSIFKMNKHNNMYGLVCFACFYLCSSSNMNKVVCACGEHATNQGIVSAKIYIHRAAAVNVASGSARPGRLVALRRHNSLHHL